MAGPSLFGSSGDDDDTAAALDSRASTAQRIDDDNDGFAGSIVTASAGDTFVYGGLSVVVVTRQEAVQFLGGLLLGMDLVASSPYHTGTCKVGAGSVSCNL
jgi:hypothetical protein